MDNTNQKTNDESVLAGGVFTFEAIRNGKTLWVETQSNIVTDEGLNYFLNSALTGGTQKTNWYIGLFSNNYTPVASVTAATVSAASGETSAYDEATRVAYTGATSAAQVVTNSANRATFSINVDGTNLYGGFLVTEALKAGVDAGGTEELLAITQFGSLKTLDDGDQLLVTYTVSAASV